MQGYCWYFFFACLSLPTSSTSLNIERTEDLSLGEDGNVASHQLKVLFFWAVDSDNRTQVLVKKNIAHARKVGGPSCCDVMLAHYRGTPSDWGVDWYTKEVAANIVQPGYKFKFLKEAFEREDWATKYEYVWALDSDIDFTSVDLKQMFHFARASGSLIVGPTYAGDQQFMTYPSLLQEQDDKKGSIIRRVLGTNEEQERSAIHLLGKPDPRCDWRHTDFVEMTAPLLHQAVLGVILKECEECIHAQAEWGLDRVWCGMATKKFSRPACALLDATPVSHLDWKTAKVTDAFKDAELSVKAKYPQYWSEVKNLDCSPVRNNQVVVGSGGVQA
eukprot:TRINITY_DN6392_c0_g2_i1.p1 TRINITY_DN6392_c0_g2~~TRINITY_DN6392_c0_g2_i1.p1  ORF type:complete len:331 (-),score=54.23 TRINITY_DN6392_c0_g2_i1:92-1084(-)